MMRTVDPRFAPALRGLGVCALVGAARTLINTTLPFFYAAEGFDARAALIRNPFYVARQWVLLVHPAFTLLLALGVALALANRAPGRAAAGVTFAGIEKMTEFLLGTSILFVVNGVWKVGYLAAADPAEAATFRGRIEHFNELLDGSFSLLWSMFILSTACFATALDPRRRLERWIVVSSAVMILLTTLMILGSFAGQDAWVQPLLGWTYAPGLTIHRLLIGLWLLRTARLSAEARTSG
jgi:hypothetical protein